MAPVEEQEVDVFLLLYTTALFPHSRNEQNDYWSRQFIEGHDLSSVPKTIRARPPTQLQAPTNALQTCHLRHRECTKGSLDHIHLMPHLLSIVGISNKACNHQFCLAERLQMFLWHRVDSKSTRMAIQNQLQLQQAVSEMLAITRVRINWVTAIFNDQVQTSFSNKPYRLGEVLLGGSAADVASCLCVLQVGTELQAELI